MRDSAVSRCIFSARASPCTKITSYIICDQSLEIQMTIDVNNGVTAMFVFHDKRSKRSVSNGPFAANGHMVHAGGQAAHWDIQNKENSNLS